MNQSEPSDCSPDFRTTMKLSPQITQINTDYKKIKKSV